MKDGVWMRFGFAEFLVGDRKIAAPWTPCRIRVLVDGCVGAIWVFRVGGIEKLEFGSEKVLGKKVRGKRRTSNVEL